MDYKLTFKKKNPILFFILLISLSIITISFKTFYFSLFIVLIWIFMEYFYRLPVLKSQELLKKLDNILGIYPLKDDYSLTSPCYGTIKKIELNKDYTRIISVLSVFDVHYQFAPMNSIITESVYKKGEFNIAYLLKKSKLNERNHVIFESNDGLKVEVIQIAGVLTRRIELIGNKKIYKKGEPYGLIHFGSRVDTIIPNTFNGKTVTLLVKEGDTLRGFNSKICIYK
jgi:phosphatidylserine decarboxylase precursor-related protein